MSAYQVEALETGDYSRLPKGTFLRGFVRNYAKLLGLPLDPVMPLLTEDAPRDGRPGIVVPTQNIRFDPLGERLQNPYVKAAVLAFVAVAIAFAAMYWWLFIRTAPPAACPQEHANRHPRRRSCGRGSHPAVAPPAAARGCSRSRGAAEGGAGEAGTREGRHARKPSRRKPTRRRPKRQGRGDHRARGTSRECRCAAGDGGHVLKFRFHGDSWVEIRDGKGKVLLSKLNSAGSETEVTARPPFSVIVGNAPEVRLFYNDREFDLEPHTKVAVARFTVE